MRRVLALIATTAALAGALIFATPQTAQASTNEYVSQVEGCGTNMVLADGIGTPQVEVKIAGFLGLDSYVQVTLPVAWGQSKFACVFSMSQFNLFGFPMGFGPTLAGSAQFDGIAGNLVVKTKLDLNVQTQINVAPVGKSSFQGCALPLALGITHSHNPDSASFSCIGLVTDPASWFFGFRIESLGFKAVEGQKTGEGSVNGLAPLQLVDLNVNDLGLGNLGTLLQPVIQPLLDAAEKLINDNVPVLIKSIVGNNVSLDMILGPVKVNMKPTA